MMKFAHPAYLISQFHIVIIQFPSLPENGVAENSTWLVGDRQPTSVLVKNQFLDSGESWAFKTIMSLHEREERKRKKN